MSEKKFGVYGELVGPTSLLTEKECLAISKCEDKTQLAVEIYEAVGRIMSKYDGLRFELCQLSEAVAPYYRDRGQFNRNINDAIAMALELYRVYLVGKDNGFDIGKIINRARISSDKATKGDSNDEY